MRLRIKRRWHSLGSQKRVRSDGQEETPRETAQPRGREATPEPDPSAYLKDIPPFEAQLVVRGGFEVVLGDGFHAGAAAPGGAGGGQEALPEASAPPAAAAPGSVRGAGPVSHIQGGRGTIRPRGGGGGGRDGPLGEVARIDGRGRAQRRSLRAARLGRRFLPPPLGRARLARVTRPAANDSPGAAGGGTGTSTGPPGAAGSPRPGARSVPLPAARPCSGTALPAARHSPAPPLPGALPLLAAVIPATGQPGTEPRDRPGDALRSPPAALGETRPASMVWVLPFIQLVWI